MNASPAPASPITPSLAMRTAASAGWVIGWRLATRLLGLLSTLVLVRILAPADFGLVALATSFAQAVDWLASIGVNEALIREKELDRPLYDTGFTLNLIRGLLMAAAIAGAATPVAAFFHDERLTLILLVLAGTTSVRALENIGTIDFRRELAFQKDFRLSVIPRAASIAVCIVLALVWRNYWALIAGIATNQLLRVALSYRLHSYRPSLGLSCWRAIIGFSFWSWICSIATMLRDRVDGMVIGRIAGPAQVGVYALGWEIGALTLTELVEPVTAALFAGFSAARRTGGELAARTMADGYMRAVSVTLLLTLPLGFGVSMLAAPIIQLGFGNEWMAALPLVQVFAIVCTARVVASIGMVLLNAYGMLRVQLAILVAGLAVRIALLMVLVAPFGLIGAAIAAAACTVVEEALYLLVTFRRCGLRAPDLLRATWRGALATLVMVLVLVLQRIAWAGEADSLTGAATMLAQGAVTGAMAYVSALLAAWWLAGRPDGAETALLGLAGSLWRQARSKQQTLIA